MFAILAFATWIATQAHPPAEIIGTWRGTSTCVDRAAAPGCNDEILVYEMTAGSKPGVVHQKGYKVVSGQNDLMGEMDFTYSDADKCWAADFSSPRTSIRWCLSVVNGVMSGSAWQLPGKQKIRKVDAKKGDGGTASPPKSAGLLTQGRDGKMRMATAARISKEAGFIDKLGSFVVGLGYGAPGYNDAALCLIGLNPGGILDPGFGKNGSVITPLLPLDNHQSVTVTALLEDASGRAIVVGWRYMSTRLDSNFPVIVAARFTSAGAIDTSFGDRGIVTTRIEQAFATQAFAATLDGEGRLLVAGYNGGLKSKKAGSSDEWPIRVVLLRYTADGALDTSFGAGGIASHVLVPAGPRGSAGRDFLLYDYGHSKTAGLILDRQGRAVVAAASDTGPVVLMRFTREGALDSSFGSAGTVETPVGKRSGISTLMWDSEGRLLAAGTSDNSGVLLRYSADGALDATFGDGGIRRTPVAEGVRVSAALQEGDGHLLVAASGMKSVQLARFDRDGRPDQTFGSNGVINTEVEKIVATIAGLALDEKGTPVVTTASENGVFLLRYNRGGPVDKSFQAVPLVHY